MNERAMIENMVEAMNDGFRRDPAAMHALMINRVPCNQALADHPTIQVDADLVCDNSGPSVTALGLINGVLGAIGLPLLAAQFTGEADDRGCRKLIGYCIYTMPAEPAKT